jgi:hypothetical protein
MRRNLLIVSWLFVASMLFSAQVWAVCPEEPFDNGECDTLHVDIHPPDQDPAGSPPHFVRFPIRVTHDIVDVMDSLAGFVIPLCYTHSNPSAYCSLSSYWNNIYLFPNPSDRSIFRDLDGETNWFWWLSQVDPPPPMPPPPIFLDVDGTSHFWFAATVWNQRFGELDQGLIATMTFKMEDTMTVCIDSCFWPPSDRLAFCNSAAQLYVPRHYLPVCEFVGPQPHPPVFTACPSAMSCNFNGTFGSEAWEAEDPVDNIVDVSAEFVGSGVTDVEVWYYGFPPPPFGGYIRFDVVDHCASGGTITITARDQAGYEGYCQFDVELGNDTPLLTLPDTVFFIGASTKGSFLVPATDANGDIAVTSFNGLWYEPDSLRPPVNSPSFTPGNPGLFRWSATETEEGPWICSFTATDACGAEATREMTILVGPLFCGDNNGDGFVGLGDVVKLLGYLYKGSSAPEPPCKGDANCDGLVDVGDAIHLLNYLFRVGSAPCFDCCSGGF